MSGLVFQEVDAAFDSSEVDACLPFVQSTPYFLWNKAYGRVGRRFVGKRDGKIVLFSQLFCYTPPYMRVLYAPLGPVIDSSFGAGDAEQFISFIRGVADSEKCAFVRLHFSSDSVDGVSGLRKGFRFTEQSSFFQPRYDRVIALDVPDAFSGDAVRSVQKAEKHLSLEAMPFSDGVVGDAEQDFLRILSDSMRKQGVRLHDEAYYRALFSLLRERGGADLLFAVCQGERIGMVLIVRSGGNATYLFGGVTEEGRKYGASYFLQWHAIARAREQGAKQYSFGGVSLLDDTRNSLYGVSFFKKKFGGTVKDYGAGYDVVLDMPRYALYGVYKFVRR